MSIMTSLRSAQISDRLPGARTSWWRLIGLMIFLVCCIGFTIVLRVITPPIDTEQNAFLIVWLISFIPYVLAGVFVCMVHPITGRGRWIELGMILLGGIVMRAIVLPLPPNLSHDSWRYLWDARVTIHGYSPYVYAPHDPQLISLRNIIYDNSRYRDVPTLYPPGAQAFYLLSYVLVPDNLIFFKGILIVCELITCIGLAWMLYKRKMDPALCLLYAWCPLPIIEFALNGHHEAIAIMFMVLAVGCAQEAWRGSRAATGFLIAIATLINLYPMLLLIVVVRRRDWVLLVTWLLTIMVAYTPYVVLGHGHILGFFSTYASELAPNAGVVPLLVRALGKDVYWSGQQTLYIGYIVDLIVVGAGIVGVLWLRKKKWLEPETGILIVIGCVFAVSTHIYPWYNAELLPWAILLLGSSGMQALKMHLYLRRIAGSLVIYFCIAAILWYFYFFSAARSWNAYYVIVYSVTLVGLVLVGLFEYLGWRKRRDVEKSVERVFD